MGGDGVGVADGAVDETDYTKSDLGRCSLPEIVEKC